MITLSDIYIIFTEMNDESYLYTARKQNRIHLISGRSRADVIGKIIEDWVVRNIPFFLRLLVF